MYKFLLLIMFLFYTVSASEELKLVHEQGVFSEKAKHIFEKKLTSVAAFGLYNFYSGRIQDALHALNYLESYRKNSQEQMLLKANLCRFKAEFEEAEQLYLKCVSLGGRRYFDAGRCAYDRKDFSRASELLSKFIEKSGDKEQKETAECLNDISVFLMEHPGSVTIEKDKIELSAEFNRGMLIKATINDVDGYWILDTGAEAIAMDISFAKRSQCIPVSEHAYISSDADGNRMHLRPYIINKMDFPGISCMNIPVYTFDFSHVIRKFDVPVAGLLSPQTLFDCFSVDFSSGKFIVFRKPQAGNMPLYQYDGNIFFISVVNNTYMAPALIDTGATRSSVSSLIDNTQTGGSYHITATGISFLPDMEYCGFGTGAFFRVLRSVSVRKSWHEGFSRGTVLGRDYFYNTVTMFNMKDHTASILQQ